MKFSLTITGSAAALAAAMEAAQSVDGSSGAQPVHNPSALDTVAAGNFLPALAEIPSTNTGTGIPQPMPIPSAPNGVAPTPPAPMPSTSADSTSTPDGPTGADELDAEGLPWDERIHSSSKKKTAKGLWAARKGGPKGDELAAIKDELRGVKQEALPMPAPAPTAAPSAPAPAPMPFPIPMPAVSEPQAVPMPVPMPTPVAEPAPAPAPTAPMPAPVSNPPSVEEWDFAKLMAVIGPKIGDGTISTEYLVQVCQKHGIGSVTDTAQKPEVIPALVAQFQADGVW